MRSTKWELEVQQSCGIVLVAAMLGCKLEKRRERRKGFLTSNRIKKINP